MLLISISSISQLRMFEYLCARIKHRYPDITFIAFGTTSDQNKIIVESAKTMGFKYDTQSPSEEDIAYSKSTKTPYHRFNTLKKRNIFSRFIREKPEISKMNTVKQIYFDDMVANLLSANRILKTYKPDLILLAEDGVSGNCFLMSEAKKIKIPVIDIPYEASGREDLVNLINEKIKNNDVIKLNPDGSIFEKLIHEKYKHWMIETSVGDALLFPPEFIISRIQLGLDLQDPWTTHGGNADAIAVESQSMLKHYRNENLPEAKLTLTGSVYCDIMHEYLNDTPLFKQSYIDMKKIKEGKTSILISLPPNYHSTRTDMNEFSSYQEMLNNIFTLLKSKNLDITISIHPATFPEDIATIEASGINVNKNSVLSLIPQHDLYFTTFSSTIRWAIACGKPVINYDAYQHDLQIYNNTLGFYNSQKIEELEHSIDFLMDDRNYHSVLRQMGGIREDWGILNGLNTENICKLIDKYIS